MENVESADLMCSNENIVHTDMSRDDIMSMRHASTSHIDNSNGYRRPNLSFSGCGLNGIYHIGVCSALQDFASHLYEDNIVSGTSAGSIAAAFLICNLSLEKCFQTVLHITIKSKEEGLINSPFNLGSSLRDALEEMLPANAHIMCNGKLHVSVTKINSYFKLENIVINQFADRKELINAILSSSFIPLISGLYFPTLNGMTVMDGGFTSNLPEPDSSTITVTPFMAEADICPIQSSSHQSFCDMYNTKVKSSFFNVERFVNLIFPGSTDQMVKLLELGYSDCVRYLLLRKFIFCQSHATVFKNSGENLSDTCTECQQLVFRASHSSVPTYLKDMIHGKEPTKYSVWAKVLDNRLTSALIHLSKFTHNINENEYSDLCRAMSILHHLKQIPVIGIIIKPLEWQFWLMGIILNVLGIFKTEKRPKKRRLRNSATRSRSAIAPAMSERGGINNQEESGMANPEQREARPLFFVPEESENELSSASRLSVSDVESIAPIIEDTVASIRKLPLDSGIESDIAALDSIHELINFEEIRENLEFDFHSQDVDLFESCSRRGSIVFEQNKEQLADDSNNSIFEEYVETDSESGISVDC